MKIAKMVHFDSAHRLFHTEWNDDRNKKIYGKCNDLHGHRYKLMAVVEGNVSKEGMIMNFSELKRILQEEVVDCYDHKCLNDCPDFKKCITTAENILPIIWNKLESRLKIHSPCVKLCKLELYETDTSVCIMEA